MRFLASRPIRTLSSLDLQLDAFGCGLNEAAGSSMAENVFLAFSLCFQLDTR